MESKEDELAMVIESKLKRWDPKWVDCQTTTTTNIRNNDDLYTAIASATERITKTKEEKMRGIVFDELAEKLKEMGIILNEIRQEPYAATEITAYIDWENCSRFLEKKELNKERYVTKRSTKPTPKKVIFSGPATTILWQDGTKTTVKCSSEDVWDDDVGIAMCYLKKMLGNKGNFNNIFREAMKVAEVQCKKEDLNVTKTINISEINAEVKNLMKNTADALDKVLGGKK